MTDNLLPSTPYTPGWQGAVAMIRRVATRKGRRRHPFFSLEGIRLHERALRAGVPLPTSVATPTFRQNPDPRIQELFADLHAAGCKLYIAPETAVAPILQGRRLGSILSLSPIPAPPPLPDLLTTTAAPLLLVAAAIVDPGNVGALIRTAHAAGAAALITVGVSDPYHPKAVRTSMGSLFKLPVYSYKTADSLLTDLAAHAIQTVGAVTGQGDLLPEAEFSTRGTAVFMGGEYHGLPAPLVAQLDTPVTIPMQDDIDSYSVNAAAAVILYEINRRRRQ